MMHAQIQRGGGEDMGSGPHAKSQKFRGLSNTGGDHKATKPEFNVGHHPHTSEMSFKWCFAGKPMMAGLYVGIWILPSVIN